MKTFRSKFIAFALILAMSQFFGVQSSLANGFDKSTCQKYVDSFGLGHSPEWSNFYNDHPQWRVYPSGPTIHVAVAGMTCSKMTEPLAVAFLESDPSITFRLKLGGPFSSRCYETSRVYVSCDWWFEIDPHLENMPDGTYGIVHGGSVDGDGYTTPFRRTMWGNPADDTFVLKKVNPPSTTTTTTTAPPPPTKLPEILDDQLIASVWSTKNARVFYTTTVRCTPTCGKLPTGFASRLCEVGTSYNSSTCISSTRLQQVGKAINTKLGVVNTFTNTFLISKKATGKKYRVYSYIPTGKKQYQIPGQDTMVWNGKSSFTNVPSPIVIPTSTVAPGATTTTITGTSPSTTSNVASSAALTVTSDSISGKTSLTVKGNGAAVNIEASIKCSGQCTKLPNSILGRLCKVGTSYTDASCTSIITLYPIGTTATSSTFRGNTTFGTSPT